MVKEDMAEVEVTEEDTEDGGKNPHWQTLMGKTKRRHSCAYAVRCL